ncbi:MAG: type II toxin-antitoxin system RelE/ParE family toxin [Coriobacteriia bacterium]|nr:type II toxin-antitoxin system RelE/ParE family toxin [Coriobacteriia bacterium]MCL2536867.1 type II toxin-antitoxin system RelE/ParE family toxin [Coriobacteriia bacterium]
MGYRVQWSNAAVKDLRRLDPQANRLIRAWVRKNLEGCDNPRAIAGGKSLQGRKGGWRYRVGSYRLLVTIVDDELLVQVVRAGHRQGVYSKL